MIQATISRESIDELTRFFNSTSKELDAASNRAIRKTLRWVTSQVSKHISEKSKVQQGVLKKRSKTSVNTTKKYGLLWFGSYDVPLRQLNPKQNKKGTKAGLRGAIFRESAFIAQQNVFKRINKKRLPVSSQAVDFSESIEGVEDKIIPNIAPELIKKLREELRWEATKR